MERRLAAILAADVADYSLLMNTDEDATFKAWKSARSSIIDPHIKRFKGRIVKHTGDGFLAEYPTVLAAVECAVEIQSSMTKNARHVIRDNPLKFRIGINLGDIIVDDEDIHGDGVNIAARLESIAQPGGVCISADVYHQVRNKPGFLFNDLGKLTVKNIRAPIQVYDVARGEKNVIAPLPQDNSQDKQTGLINNILDQVNHPSISSTAFFVGRNEEKQVLADAFDQAESGQGNIVLIRGEPGIGKSCLAHSFSGQAQASGAMVAFGQCHETLGSPPFWPWLQILKSLQSSADSTQAPSANILEHLAAAESVKTHTHQSTFASIGGTEQLVLFSKIVSLLSECASKQPLVLVIDDLHWADRSSLLLLTYLCRKLAGQPILIIGTYRDIEVTRKHPLFESLGEINRESTLNRIALKGLSQKDVSGLLGKSVNHRLPEHVLRALHEKTEGNPLFVSEVAGILNQKNTGLENGRFILEIPDGIQEAIGRRLNLLSDSCTDLLSIAAVIGRRFNLRVLGNLMPDSDQLAILQILEEASNKGIIRESEDGIGEFQFGHVLTRDILYNELSLVRKVILHSQIADSLVQIHKSGFEQSLGEIARHYYQALQSGQTANALDYSIKAAEHAYKLSGFDEAAGYYEMALDVLKMGDAGHQESVPEIYLQLASCFHASGAPSRKTVNALDRCLDESRKRKRYTIFAEAACRKVYQGREQFQMQAALVTIDEALSFISDEDRIIRANLLAHRAMALAFNNRRREAEQVAYKAIDVAGNSGNSQAHSKALCMTLLVLRGRPEKLSERIRLGEQALEIAQNLDVPAKDADPQGVTDPIEWLILSYQESGDMKRVKQLVYLLDVAVKNTYRFKAHYNSVAASASLALFEGRWKQAESFIESAVELGTGTLDGGAEGVYGAQMFLLNRELGRLPMIYAALRKLVGDHQPIWQPGLLATYTDLGLEEEARPLFMELAARNFNFLADDELLLTCLVYLTEACVELECADKASSLYHRLLPWSGQMVSHPTAVCYGPADLYLGMLLSQMNRLSEARIMFNQAGTLCDQAGPNIWSAHINYRHAQMLKRYGASADQSEAVNLINQARTQAQFLGMVNLLNKIDKLEQQSTEDIPDNTNGMTQRELEVLSLIVQGKSNKLIASELNRSLATVATHVRAILGKTHSANRTEAAAFATEHNLFGK